MPGFDCFIGLRLGSRGSRFNYTYYTPAPNSEASSLSRSSRTPSGQPIHASIEALDREGMAAVTLNSDAPQARDRHACFGAYLKRTSNTICGRHPIGVLLATVAHLQDSKAEGWQAPNLRFLRYEQSSQCKTAADSSVSYASAYLTLS